MVSDPARALFDAAALGAVERVRELLAAGADPSLGLQNRPAGFSPAAFSPFAVAVEYDYMEVVEMLLEAGAAVREHDEQESLLALAPSLRMIEFLLARGASPSSPTSFSHSVVDAVASENAMPACDRVAALRLLAKHGAELDARVNTLTLLWRLANQANADAVDAALQAGADPCADPSALAGAVWGSFPGSAEYGTPENINRTIDLLVAAGCDVHERDGNGWQPLHGALMEYSHGAGFMSSDGCNGPAAEALLRHGASVDIVFDTGGCRFPAGSRPLHVAAAQADAYAVRVLIAAGAKRLERVAGATTPADLAREALAYQEQQATASDEQMRAYHGRGADAARECLRLLA
ncbi:MAG: hypothetical protein ACT4OX_11470 [Actinomycetota bacterium]